MLLKSYHCMNLEGYFGETFSLKGKIKRVWYFKFRFISGDGKHWVMWFKQGKDKFYFDSYGVQPSSERIAYLMSPIFYNSERVQQNGAMFCGHLCVFALKQLSLLYNLQAVINNLIYL